MVVLYAGILLVLVLFGFAAHYSPIEHIALDVGLIGFLSGAAWILGARALFGAFEEPRLLAAAGILLITPPLLFALLAGYGRPDQATVAENYVRYVVLFISIIATGIGMIILKEAVGATGERFFSTLGFAAIVLASPLYLVWVSVALEYLTQRLNGVPLQPPLRALVDLSDLWLFFGGALTYLATAAFIAAMYRTKWLGPVTASMLASISVVGLILLSVRGFAFPNPHEAFQHWYTTIGWIAGIPAVPWLVPNALGVILLWRAGDRSRN
jgi:hypothetical protein